MIDFRAILPRHETKTWNTRTCPIDCFCIHHSATGNATTPFDIARYHVYTKDMPSAQYHYIITPDGKVYWCNDDNLYVWHGNALNTGLGVCLIGNFTSTHPTDAQIAAARNLYQQKQAEYGPLRLVGHKEAWDADTECPGNTWLEWKNQISEEPMGKHILSIHTQRQCELGTEPTETIRNSNLPWLKAMDADTWHAPVNVMFPGKRVVIRLHLGGSTGDKREHEFMRRGAQGAREYIALLQPRIDKCIAGGVRDFEGPNEIHPNGADNPWDAFVEFQWELARYYVGRGCRYWALSLGVGWMPNIADIVRFRDLLLYCAANGGGLAVHEYGCPSVLDGNGYWTMRIRKTLDALYDAGVARNSIPVIITEASITWALLGEADTGWNSHPGWVYPAQYGLPEGIMTRERIWRQMLAYEERIMAEVPEVQMINWFTTLPFGDWLTFDVNTEMVGWVCGLYTEVVGPPADLEQIIGDAIQQHIIPLNPNAALERAGMALGLLPASDEVRDVEGYVAQAFRKPGEEGWQEIAYCADGDWGNINWFRRAN